MPVALELAGFASVTAGVALVSRPAGLIVGGLLAVLTGYLLDGVSLRLPKIRRRGGS